MAGLAVKNGLQKALGDFIAGELSLGSGVRLYKNNYTPTLDSVDTDFTELTSSDFPSYAPIDPNWSTPPVFDGTVSFETDSDTLEWTADSLPGGPVTIYGWFLKTASAMVLAEKFALPVVLSTVGEVFSLDISIKLKNS